MPDEDAIRSALHAAGEDFGSNPARLDSVLHRHAGRRRRRAVGASMGVVAVALGTVAVSATWDRPIWTDGPAATDEWPRTHSVTGARAVPGGVEVEVVGYIPDPPYGDPCAVAYDVAGRRGDTPGELVVTVTERRVSPQPIRDDLVCNTVGHEYKLLVATTERPATVRDSTTGKVFRVRDPGQPT